jgi:methionyl-tRNA formyltransferase
MNMRVLILGSKRLCLRMTERFVAIDRNSVGGIVTFDDSADTRSALGALLDFGSRLAIPVHVARDRRHAESLIADARVDLCIVLNWYWLLGRACLASVPRGFLGVHMSPLPRYRGSSPVVWQLINGEPEVGFSVFTLAEDMDSGDLWAQGAVPVGADDEIAEVLSRLETAVGATFDTLYPALLNETARAFPQPNVTPTYCVARLPDDGGIDFTQSARRCHDFVRAQSRPYPGAFTIHEGERLVIWRTEALDMTYFGRPGQVARVADDRIAVICGDNHPLVIQTVGWRGEDLPAREVIRSVKIRFPATPN